MSNYESAVLKPEDRDRVSPANEIGAGVGA